MILETLPDLTAEDFALMWSAEFEDHCESDHLDCGPCTHIVVAIKMTDCGARIRICKTSLEWNRRAIAKNSTKCSGCYTPVADCWHILPL